MLLGQFILFGLALLLLTFLLPLVLLVLVLLLLLLFLLLLFLLFLFLFLLLFLLLVLLLLVLLLLVLLVLLFLFLILFVVLALFLLLFLLLLFLQPLQGDLQIVEGVHLAGIEGQRFAQFFRRLGRITDPPEILQSHPPQHRRRVVDRQGDADTHPTRADGEGTFSAFNGKRSGGRIDWILHSPTFRTVSAAIDRTEESGRFPSDHYPVTAVLRWKD